MARRCRTAKGRFRKCGSGTKGVARKSSRKGKARKGRCVKWSKGRKRCLKRG